ncbi:MAG TPA: chorismate-binding protein, partial [Alphaproteobacteria bacterium]|nr:chorismate-binding protein [Alphaproteobacteria bacterium]
MKKINIKQWQGKNAAECYEAIADQPYALFFDSNRPSHPLSRWSFVCWDPIETITAKNGVIEHNGAKINTNDVFAFLQKRLDDYKFSFPETDIPFTGGIAGYFGYDLGRQLEVIPSLTDDDINIPDMMVGIYTNVLAFNHPKNKAWKIGDAELPARKRKTFTTAPLHWTAQKNEKDYCRDIQSIIDYIHAGEVYQVNLSRRFEADLPDDFDAFGHYKNLRNINPAPYAAFMNFGRIKLASSSPEQFLSVNGDKVETRPIKGTLPSSQSA